MKRQSEKHFLKQWHFKFWAKILLIIKQWFVQKEWFRICYSYGGHMAYAAFLWCLKFGTILYYTEQLTTQLITKNCKHCKHTQKVTIFKSLHMTEEGGCGFSFNSTTCKSERVTRYGHLNFQASLVRRFGQTDCSSGRLQWHTWFLGLQLGEIRRNQQNKWQTADRVCPYCRVTIQYTASPKLCCILSVDTRGAKAHIYAICIYAKAIKWVLLWPVFTFNIW